jgi:CheY-like chemotaxis protein
LASTRGALKILVADDDPQIVSLLREALGSFGHIVSVARNGAEAIRAFDGASFALLITDFQMPDLTGVQVIEELRRRRLQIPALLVSSHLPDEVRAAFATDDLVVLLEKPFSLEELREAIESAVRVGK